MLYHYTILIKFQQILREGKLKASGNAKKYGGRNVNSLWFSSDAHWEPTAAKKAIINGAFKHLTMEEHHQLTGIARIGVEKTANFISWGKYVHLSGLPTRTVISMAARGNCSRWFCLLNDMPSNNWKTVEVWDGSNWLPYNEEKMKEALRRYPYSICITQDNLQR